MVFYETERLILREWLDSDVSEYVALNLDSHVMRFFPSVYQEQDSIDGIKRFQEHLQTYGYTIYACELKSSNEFIGFVGLYNRSDMPFSPCVEIGWRLAQKYWGNGYAPEAAAKCLEIGFSEFGLDEIVAFTPKINIPSERVMQKIGMAYNPVDDFLHYKIKNEHKLCLHILYRLSKNEFLTQSNKHIFNVKK